MKATLLLLLLVLSSFVSSDIWTSCGTASDSLTISGVTISPDPPVKGQNVTVAVSGSLSESITSGTVTIKIKYGIIYIVNETDNICTADPQITCPITAGTQAIKQTVLVPDTIPAGNYAAGVSAYDQNNLQIFCVNVTLSF